MLPELLLQIPPDEQVADVGGNGVYDTDGCHTAIAQWGTQAVIPPRKNTKTWIEKWIGAAVRKQAL